MIAKSVSKSSTAFLADLTEKKTFRVLHVDDDLGFLKIAKKCLEMQGPFQVDTASSVDEANEKLRKQAYDAVVSDYQMPGKEGLEFLQELRQSGNTVPFVIFTGRGREEAAIKALNLGADQYLNKNGDPETVYCELGHAISKAVERKDAEDALRESEEKFRTIAQRSFDMILTLNPEGEITYVSQAAEIVGGYEPQEIIGKPFFIFLHESEISEGALLLQRIMAGEYAKSWELTICRKNGTAATLEVNAFPVVKDGKIVEIRATTRDITGRKEYEAELRRLASFPERNPNPVLEIDLTGKITYLNQAARKVLSQLRDSRLSNGLEEDISAIISEFNVHQSDNFLHETAKIGNRYYQQAIHYVPEKAALRLYMVDITERKKIEEEFLRQTTKSEEYLNIVGNIIVAIDRNRKITFLNRKGYKTLGYGEGELFGKDWFETCLPEEDKEEVKKAFEACVQGKLELAEYFENPILAKNGERRVVSWHNTVLKDGNGKIIGTLSSGEDITERRRTEEAFKKSAEETRSLLEFQNRVIDTAVVWINILNKDGSVTLWNRAAELISGYSREEVIGHKKIWEWLYPDPQYRAKIFANAQKTIYDEESVMQNFETVARCKNGTLKTISWYANSITDAKKKPIGSITIGLDVSQLRKAERELHEAMEKLQVMNEKLQVVGDLTRHDVRNKLAAIVGNAYLAKEESAANSRVLECLGGIEKAVQQSARIFDFAKTYEMLGVEELTYIDVENAIEQAVSLVVDLRGTNVVDDCHGLTVLADSLLQQLFYNLIDNSLKYGQKTTRIRVYYEKSSKNELVLVYEDDGVGIPAAEKPKLFTEGYSTGGSTGHGLYLIKKMTEVYGWTIQEKGEPGKGARFLIRIPNTRYK